MVGYSMIIILQFGSKRGKGAIKKFQDYTNKNVAESLAYDEE